MRNTFNILGTKKERKRGVFSKNCRIFALFDFVQEMGLEPFDNNSNVSISRPFCGYVGKSVGNFFTNLFYFITNEKAFPPQEMPFLSLKKPETSLRLRLYHKITK